MTWNKCRRENWHHRWNRTKTCGSGIVFGWLMMPLYVGKKRKEGRKTVSWPGVWPPPNQQSNDCNDPMNSKGYILQVATNGTKSLQQFFFEKDFTLQTNALLPTKAQKYLLQPYLLPHTFTANLVKISKNGHFSHMFSKNYAKYLVGGFNQFEKYESNWIISTGLGVKIKRCLKPPTRYQWNQYVLDHSKTPSFTFWHSTPSARQRRMLLRSTGIFWESAILYLVSQSHPQPHDEVVRYEHFFFWAQIVEI